MNQNPPKPGLPSRFLLGIIWGYKHLLSPLLPMACRFEPTCSMYAAEAIKKYGPLKGGRMAVKRISSCHPWGGHGYDPVK
jgi:putative membrane protein insertion efficiency factor